MTNDQIEDLMRQAGLEAIADKDYRASAGEPMTVTEQDRYEAILSFAQLVRREALEEAAKICDEQADCHSSREFLNTQAAVGCDGCAEAIRGLGRNAT